jgi:hypothetical protein
MLVREVGCLVEGQRQFRRTSPGEPHVPGHAEPVGGPLAILHERGMPEHVLVADDEHRNAMSPDRVVDAEQRLEEVDDEVRLDRRHRLVDRRDALPEARRPADDARGRAKEGDAATAGDGEPRAGDRPHSPGERFLKECRQAPALARPDEDGGDVMPVSLQHLLHRDRLRHVPPAFALHREHHFHGIESG